MSALLGLVTGSFLAAASYRLPRNIPVSTGRSMCTACGKTLKWYDLVPFFSFLFLGGRCRYCKARISFRYPLIELANGLAFALVFLAFGYSLHTVAAMVLAGSLVFLSTVDLEHMIIPDEAVLAILMAGILLAVFSPEIPLLSRIIGFFAVSLPMFLIAWLKPDGLGGGDIKLMAAAGFFLGWQSILLALVIGSVAGAIYGVWVLARRKMTRKDPIPFGPFLAGGIFIAMLYGAWLVEGYLRLVLQASVV